MGVRAPRAPVRSGESCDVVIEIRMEDLDVRFGTGSQVDPSPVKHTSLLAEDCACTAVAE